MTTKQNIEKTLWKACDSFRGKIDSSRYKDYILSMLFVKYLSDVFSETKAKYIEKYNGDERRIERAMSRERFVLDEESTFTYLYNNRNDAEIGQKINVALAAIENNNSAKLHNVFRAIDFNSTVDFGEPKEKNAILKNLLEDFSELDLSPSQLDSTDIIGDSYEYMIANFASDAGKKGGEFYTPSKVSELVARLVQPQENERIYDATCGSGGLLLKAFKQIPSRKARIYGQEQNMQTWALCRMNMFLHGVDDAVIWQGDTLSNPGNIENDQLMQFQCIVANPPFSLDKWDSGFLSNAGLEAKGSKKPKMSAELDPYRRFDWGIPPTSKGDYAFVMHMLHSLDAEKGRMGIILPHGVLFRGAGEGKIRRTIVEKFNFLDAVIGLPANLFYGAGIPACILIFRKNRGSNDKVLFLDASGEGNYEKGKNQNILRECDVKHIVDTYNEYRNNPEYTGEEKYAHIATLAEIKENDYNLNIPRYVDTFEKEPLIDIEEVKQNIANIETELAEVQAQMAKYMEELGI
jgi:type I restriction enzyme M protein